MKTARIMVVEDSPTMRQLLLYALRKLPSVQIVEASDGVDALRKMPEGDFNLVITDINMPVMSGLKLLSMMKSNPSYKDIPVIIVTTEGHDDDRNKGMEGGAYAYVPKPIQTPHLLKVVKEALGRN